MVPSLYVMSNPHPPNNLVADVGKMRIKLGFALTSLKEVVLDKVDVENTIHLCKVYKDSTVVIVGSIVYKRKRRGVLMTKVKTEYICSCCMLK